MHCSKERCNSITSPARPSSVRETVRPSVLEVNDGLELGWLHHRQVSGLLTLENTASTDADLAIPI
jgi:hypothetical protein